MTREQKIAKVRALREQGLTVSEIAAATGIARSTVGDYLLGDEHNYKVRQQRVPPCPRCGQPMLGWQPSRPATGCGACRAADADAHAREYVRLWAEGKTLRQIAAHFGYSLGAAPRELHRLRERGYDLPFRYPKERVSNIRAGTHAYWSERAA